MKKIMFLLLILTACAGTTDAGNGLTRFETEPDNCEYLYALDSKATTYDESDAYDYVEKTILDQNKYGDSYYIVKKEVLENKGAIFGPKNTYKFKVKVYNCDK